MQYYTTLHYTTPHYTTLHYTTLHYTTLHYTTLHYTTPHHTTPHYTALHYTHVMRHLGSRDGTIKKFDWRMMKRKGLEPTIGALSKSVRGIHFEGNLLGA